MTNQHDAHKELFLDMLTKEEKEALLTKKMESLRKQNEAIQKRYEEVEADKKRAEQKLGSNLPAQKESPSVTRTPTQTEDHDLRRIRLLQQQSQPNRCPATRNKLPTPRGGGSKGPREHPVSQDFLSEAAFEYEPIVDITDLDYRQAKRTLSPSKTKRNASQENAFVVSNSTHISWPHGASDTNRNLYRTRKSRSYNSDDNRSRDNQACGAQPRGSDGSCLYMQTFNSRKQDQDRDHLLDGPPPDPAYNYLSDRARDPQFAGKRQSDKSGSHDGQGGGGRETKDPRRHPRNFGGADFSNVKSQMKAAKEKEKDRRSCLPRNRLEMTVNMTGTERFHYEEWKAERQKVDQERLDRQMTASGEWRRAWDQEKNCKEYDESSSAGRTEPAKRPVGRIGSGRFDRGDRDDRRAENLSQSPKASSLIQGVISPDSEWKPAASRSRGRGRARARALQIGSGEKPARPRTWSGADDSRTVQCSNDMLVVKIDKSRSSDDHSVEVEYGSGNEAEKKKSSSAKKKPGRRSPTKQKQQLQQPSSQFKDAETPDTKSIHCPPMLASSCSQDSNNNDARPTSLSQSLSIGSTDEWEDITGTDSDIYATTTEDEGESHRRGSGRLNPEAPIFLPNSPELKLSSPVQSGFNLVSLKDTSSSPSTSVKTSDNFSQSHETTRPLVRVEESTSNSRSECEIIENEDDESALEEKVSDDESVIEDHRDGPACSTDFVDMENNTGKETDLHTDSQATDKKKSNDNSQATEFLDATRIDDDKDVAASSLADELCAAGAQEYTGIHAHVQNYMQDKDISHEVDEVEEDDAEGESELKVSSHVDSKRDAHPSAATVSDLMENKSEALDVDNSCQAAPATSTNSFTKPVDEQMVTSEEFDGSLASVQGPSSSYLASMIKEADQESVKSKVMEIPEAENATSHSVEAVSEHSTAVETVSTTPLALQNGQEI